MNAQHTAKLRKDFPKLFSDPRFRGFECGDGWFELIYGLSEKLSKIRARVGRRNCTCEVCRQRRANRLRAESVRALQVKEKFGELRYYIAPTTHDRAYQLLEQATNVSITICETCGKRGKIHSLNGIWKTVCPKHAGGKP